MFFTEYLDETQSSAFSNPNPRKRRLKSLIPKNAKAFPQDFFAINQSFNTPPIILSRESPVSEENTQRHSFPLEPHPIPLPRNPYTSQQNGMKKELKIISSQPTFRIRDRVVLAPILNDGKSSDRTHVSIKKFEEDTLTARGLYSGSTDQFKHILTENQNPRNKPLLDLPPKGPTISKRFFIESTNYSYTNQSKSTEKSFSIHGCSIIEQDIDDIESPGRRNGLRLAEYNSAFTLAGHEEGDTECCKTPGFKNLESGLSTKREKIAEPRREEFRTFSQNCMKQQAAKMISKPCANKSKQKLDFNQFTLSKPKVQLTPIISKENKENINVNRKPPKIQTKKPSFRVLPSLKKGLMA